MRKLLSVLICMSMLLSLICLPVSAAEVTANQTSMLYYADDGSISVGSSYSEMQNLWIKFAPTGANGLLAINSFYKDGKNKTEPTTLWYEAGDEWISPVKFSADSGSGETVFTGGSRTFADGTPTAKTEKLTVKLDGEEVQPDTTASGGVVEITVENKLKAGNDKSGDWALLETVVYTIYDCIVDTEVTLKALQSGRIIEYNGPQAKIYSDYYMPTIYFANGRKPAYSENDYYKYNSGTKADYPNARSFRISSAFSDSGDLLRVILDNKYGLGRLAYLTDSEMPVVTVDDNNMAAFHLVAPVSDTQSKDYVTCRMYKGGYVFFSAEYKFTYSEIDLSEFFEAKLSDVTSVSAVLKTNMPIDVTNATLRIGENLVDIAETDVENIYALSFAEPIDSVSGLGPTMKGTANVTSYDTKVSISKYIGLKVALTFELSHATENVMLLETNLPIDVESAVINIENESCSIEKLANEHNKYAIRSNTPLTPGKTYEVTVYSLKNTTGNTSVSSVTKSVTVEKGVTQITGTELIINENGTKAARLTGTNNVVGYCPVVVAAAYSEDMLCSVDYKKLLLPYDGELPTDTDSAWLWVDTDTERVRTYVLDNLVNLMPLSP